MCGICLVAAHHDLHVTVEYRLSARTRISDISLGLSGRAPKHVAVYADKRADNLSIYLSIYLSIH